MSLGLAYMAAHSPLMMRLSDWPGELKSISGIYCLIINGKCYIGQSKNLKSRIGSYRCEYGKKFVIGRALNKHGIDSCFVVVVGEYPMSMLDEYEHFWIEDLGSLVKNGGYNILDGPPKYCKGDKNHLSGIKLSEKTKMLMRKPKPSISMWNIRLKGKPVVKVSADTGCVVAEFPSSRNAATIEGIKCTSMSGRCNKKRPPRDGYFWRWKDDYNKEDGKWSQLHPN